MKRSLSLISLNILGAMALMAAPITPEAALERMQENSSLPGLNTRSASKPVLKMTVKSNDGLPGVYVFDKTNNDGYLVLSADDLASPVLGYADSGTIDDNNISPTFKWWLNEYSRQIAWARANETSATPATRADLSFPSLAAISPLVKTKWDQDAPYNNLCPVINDTTCVTGCVATAMSQVMNYFQWPSKGMGSIRYTNEANNATLSMDFSSVTFDWSNMLDSYSGSYTQTQATAVATLMKAAGYSVEMQYTTDESGAYSEDIASALTTYFNYDKNVSCLERDWYTYTDWVQMIYDNLKNIGPVIYNGVSPSGGHSFVCDGYLSEGYFHINWGWSGMSDGYFLLNALNPASLGIGGGLGGGFNYMQSVLFGIQKPNSSSSGYAAPLYLYNGSITATMASTNPPTLTLGATDEDNPVLLYQGTGSITFNLGIKFTPVSGSAAPIYATSNATDVTLDLNHMLPLPNVQIDLMNTGLVKGEKYMAQVVYQTSGGSWQPIVTDVGEYNYFYITKNNLLSYTIENNAPMTFDYSNLSVNSTLYYGSGVKVSATFKNSNDTELSKNVYFVLLPKADSSISSMAFYGEGDYITLSPGETQDREWTTSLTQYSSQRLTMPQQYYPALADIDSGTIFYVASQPVTMQAAAPSPQFSASLSIAGAQVQDGQYVISNAYNFTVSTQLSVSSGYFSEDLYLGIFTSDGYLENGYPYGTILLNSGESTTLTTTVNFSAVEIGTTYRLGTYYFGSDNKLYIIEDALTPVVFTGASGVATLNVGDGNLKIDFDRTLGKATVSGEGNVNVEVFTISGERVPAGVETITGGAVVDLSGLGKGVVIITATDSAGHRASSKILL